VFGFIIFDFIGHGTGIVRDRAVLGNARHPAPLTVAAAPRGDWLF
jgi:hypothetical protein